MELDRVENQRATRGRAYNTGGYGVTPASSRNSLYLLW